MIKIYIVEGVLICDYSDKGLDEKWCSNGLGIAFYHQENMIYHGLLKPVKVLIQFSLSLVKIMNSLLRLLTFRAFRVNRDQAMNLEIRFKIYTNISNFETTSPKII